MSHYLSLEICVMNAKACIQSNYRAGNPTLEAALGSWRQMTDRQTDEPVEKSNKSYRFIAYQQYMSWMAWMAWERCEKFGHDDVILGVKYLECPTTSSIFEFSTLKIL